MDRCSNCGRAMRYGNTPAAEAPGTVRGYRTGLCVTCSRRAHGQKRVNRSCLPTCERCRRRMRPDKALKADWPDTVARVNKTTCVSCFEKAQRGLPAWEREARRLEVPALSHAQRTAAARTVVRAGGDTMILEMLDIQDVYAEVR